MRNPWEEIDLSDYENHMSLESVYQLPILNKMMGEQFETYDVDTIMILGIAGGNGLEHINKEQINTGDSFVSDSPYIHAFDCLEEVHHQMEKDNLVDCMSKIDYQIKKITEQTLPNGKKFVRLDFVRNS